MSTLKIHERLNFHLCMVASNIIPTMSKLCQGRSQMTHVRSANKAKETVCTSLRIVIMQKRMICKYAVSTLKYSRTRNSEFVESNSFKLRSQLCESNLEKMDSQKSETYIKCSR
ncbi:hypothetical protein ACJW30_03G159300 [Castanea mollissima]